MAKEKNMAKKLANNLERLARYFERANLADYVSTIQKRPLRLLLINFSAGIARGLGIAIGMTLIFAILVYIMSKMIDLPIVGKYIAEIVKIVNINLKEGIKIR